MFQFSLHITLKRNLQSLGLFLPFEKKAKISKDVIAECKLNLLQKKMTEKKAFSRFLYVLNKAKKLKDKNIMVNAGKGVAALPVTIALCRENILLVQVVSSGNFLYL